jgi:trehalose 6-phosphate phosphatase
VTASEVPAPLRPLLADPARTAILLDFDGTLADIVARPELAAPAPGAREAVAGLVDVFGEVAVISGRPTEDVRGLLGVDGVRYLGLYGLGGEGVRQVPADVRTLADAAAEAVPDVWVEDKGGSVAVHYRQAADAAGTRSALLAALADVPAGFEAIEGKMVVELVPAERPRKGGAVRTVIEESEAQAAMYAGDDLADLEAFAELDLLGEERHLRAVRVAVEGPETPTGLTAAADHVVPGPSGLVAILGTLASAADPEP